MPGIRRALVLAPMTSELRPVVKYLGARRSTVDGLGVYEGRAGDVEVSVVRIGVGPETARRSTQRALGCIGADHVLVSGIAGGLHPDLAVGSVVVPETVVDLASGRRYASSPIEGIERRGLVATADHLVTDEEELETLQREGVLAMEMESSGVAEACEAAGVPWTTFRVIGDRPDEHLTDDSVMELLRPDGSADIFGGLRFMVLHPRRIRGMLRLGRDSSRAASRAARTALGSLGWVRA